MRRMSGFRAGSVRRLSRSGGVAGAYFFLLCRRHSTGVTFRGATLASGQG